MMQTKDFPPQAYTKETVSEAFTWLQSQPEEIKKQATHTHQLVALYLKHKSQQYWAFKTNTPTENQDFNGQLQSMASKIPSDAQQSEQTQPSPPHTSDKEAPYPFHANGKAAPHAPPLTHDLQRPPLIATQNPHIAATLKQLLDSKSLAVLQNVKTQLNLSSDVEANRLLIKLGLERIKPLFAGDDPDASIKDT